MATLELPGNQSIESIQKQPDDSITSNPDFKDSHNLVSRKMKSIEASSPHNFLPYKS